MKMIFACKRDSSCTRRGQMDIITLLVVIALLAILISILLPALARAKELAKRTTCAANLIGIGKGLYAYANDGNQGMPIADHAEADSPEMGKVRYAPGMIGKHRGQVGKPQAGESQADDTELSTTRNLWTLVRVAGSVPASFICPSSGDKPNDEDDPFSFWDFRGYGEVSYGYQVPYGKLGRPNIEGDQRVVLSGEKGPYSAVLEAKAPDPGVPIAGIKDPSTRWRPWNSPNHRGQGQNVLYADSHVDWAAKPTTGVSMDNIYTRWSDALGGDNANLDPRIHGTPPTGIEVPWSNTDTLLYP